MQKDKLNNKQLKAAELIAKGFSEREVCKVINIGKGTINRWKKIPLFQTCVNRYANVITQEIQEEYQRESERQNQIKLVASEIRQTYEQELKESYGQFLEELKLVRERQKKWSAAITETGIKSLKVVNSYLLLAEKAPNQNLSRQQMELVKLIPSFMRAASESIKSASDTEDKAYSLSELAIALDELSTNIPNQSRESHLKNISSTDS